METNTILSANILDILFDGRNKDYGAYDLRKSYNKRINTALGITAIAVMLFIVAIIGKNKTQIKGNVPDLIFEATTTPLKKEKDKIEMPKKNTNHQIIKSDSYTKPVIVQNNIDIKPQVEVDKIDGAIDTKTIDGKDAPGIIPPSEINGNSAVEAPVKKEDKTDVLFYAVEIEAKFNGNWGAYLKKEIEKNLDELTEANESGTCIVRFIVSKDGSVSNVEAMTMKGTKLAEVAVNAIRKGPKWIPAIQNGTQVNAYRQQPITFKINE